MHVTFEYALKDESVVGRVSERRSDTNAGETVPITVRDRSVGHETDARSTMGVE